MSLGRLALHNVHALHVTHGIEEERRLAARAGWTSREIPQAGGMHGVDVQECEESRVKHGGRKQTGLGLQELHVPLSCTRNTRVRIA